MPDRPAVSGLHHLTFVVSSLESGIDWFESVLGARHEPRFDHHDASGALFGVILALPAFAGMLELRLATPQYAVPVGYDPVTFEVADDDALEAWFQHVEALGAEHSPVKQRRTGRSLEITTPDGVVIRLFTAPAGGFAAVPFQEQHVDH
ncbi:MAG: glyoxalase/bleomycin resistance protein/dioxygenase [Subtercola sp.]|nr:glyoxalase/bleomycin resistance protein/dioxygenase [Subtercola sp.]